MPIYEYKCLDCHETSEVLLAHSQDLPRCVSCGSENIKKLMSPHSSMSRSFKNTLPGLGDTACCGSSPGLATGCAGPGSCCGKTK